MGTARDSEQGLRHLGRTGGTLEHHDIRRRSASARQIGSSVPPQMMPVVQGLFNGVREAVAKLTRR